MSVLGKSKAVWVVLKATLLGLILWYVFRDVQWDLIAGIFTSIPAKAFLLAAVVQAVLQCLQAARWKLLIAKEIPYKVFMGYISMGYVLGIVSPSVALSDGLKSYLLGRRSNNLLDSMSSMLLARLTGLFVLVCFFVVLFPSHKWVFSNLDFRLQANGWIYFSVFLLLLGGGLYLYLRRRSDLLRVKNSFRDMLNAPAKVMRLLLLSLLIQVFQMAFVFVTYHFTGAPLTYIHLMFIVPLITLISLVPLTIGQIGVREGLSVFFLTLFPGVYKEHVLAAAAFYYALMVVFGLLNAWLAYIWLKAKA